MTESSVGERRTAEGDVLRAVIDTVVDGIVITDREGLIRIFNPAAETLFRYSAQEMVGQNIAVLLSAADAQQHGDFIRAYRESGRRQVVGVGREVRGRRKDGALFPMNLAIGETSRGGELAYVGIMRDITEQKKTYAALTDARMKAELASNAKTEFLSRMSHELRTPMNAIIGFAQLLQMKAPDALAPEQYADYLESILGPARHLSALIDDILDIARIEIGQFNVAVRAVDLGTVVRESMAITAPMAERRGITVKANLGAAPAVLADPLRVTQCVVNLLTNAIKYNHAGGSVTVEIEKAPRGRVRLTVADTGIGIPEQQLGDLFIPFKRLHRSREDIEGVGIGLALVKQLVEAMRGTIAVESRPEKGTTFHLDLMEADAIQAHPKGKHRPRPAAPPRAATNEPKVALYVEDNPANVHLMRTLFDGLPKTELKIAYTGETGLAMAVAEPVNLIILDINLPGIDGFETMSRLRNGARTSTVPVIGLSARATERDIDRASELGFYRYFTKPMNVPEFMETVRTVL